MQTMSHTTRIVTSLLAGCLAIVAANTLLALAGAGSAWYYAAGVCVTGCTTYLVLVPALGTPTRPRWLANRRGDTDETHIPHPRA
jgi:hypothetical protein